MKKNLTCIVCPMGCDITVTLEKGEVVDIKGNTCPRGAEYAKNECTNPVRTITTTVMCSNGKPVSVKTSSPIPKSKIFECMKIINSVRVNVPVFAGDVIIENIADCKADIVATQNILE